jgi:hypothetical protein
LPRFAKALLPPLLASSLTVPIDCKPIPQRPRAAQELNVPSEAGIRPRQQLVRRHPSKDARTRLSGAMWGKRSQFSSGKPTRTEAKLGPNPPVQRPTRGQLSPCRWHSLAKSNPRQRFRNGLSVAAYVWRLTCCFILITGGRTCGDFASASRFACTSSEACAHCAMSALDLRSSCVTVPRY